MDTKILESVFESKEAKGEQVASSQLIRTIRDDSPYRIMDTGSSAGVWGSSFYKKKINWWQNTQKTQNFWKIRAKC